MSPEQRPASGSDELSGGRFYVWGNGVGEGGSEVHVVPVGLGGDLSQFQRGLDLRALQQDGLILLQLLSKRPENKTLVKKQEILNPGLRAYLRAYLSSDSDWDTMSR